MLSTHPEIPSLARCHPLMKGQHVGCLTSLLGPAWPHFSIRLEWAESGPAMGRAVPPKGSPQAPPIPVSQEGGGCLQGAGPLGSLRAAGGSPPSSPHRTNRFYPAADLAAALGQESTWENRNPPGPDCTDPPGSSWQAMGRPGPRCGGSHRPRHWGAVGHPTPSPATFLESRDWAPPTPHGIRLVLP